jgi:uncharacterized protein YaaW (UPF0174 family)
MAQSDERATEALMQLKKSSQLKIDAHYNLAKNAIENYYSYAVTDPELAKKAVALASEDTMKIYLDYLERVTRLNEEMMQRLIDASSNALKKCMQEQAKEAVKNVEKKEVKVRQSATKSKATAKATQK